MYNDSNQSVIKYYYFHWVLKCQMHSTDESNQIEVLTERNMVHSLIQEWLSCYNLSGKLAERKLKIIMCLANNCSILALGENIWVNLSIDISLWSIFLPYYSSVLTLPLYSHIKLGNLVNPPGHQLVLCKREMIVVPTSRCKALMHIKWIS